MYYNLIVNPNTNKKYSIYSCKGKKILKKFIGGAQKQKITLNEVEAVISQITTNTHCPKCYKTNIFFKKISTEITCNLCKKKCNKKEKHLCCRNCKFIFCYNCHNFIVNFIIQYRTANKYNKFPLLFSEESKYLLLQIFCLEKNIIIDSSVFDFSLLIMIANGEELLLPYKFISHIFKKIKKNKINYSLSNESGNIFHFALFKFNEDFIKQLPLVEFVLNPKNNINQHFLYECLTEPNYITNEIAFKIIQQNTNTNLIQWANLIIKNEIKYREQEKKAFELEIKEKNFKIAEIKKLNLKIAENELKQKKKAEEKEMKI